ncbi:IS66-like element accessory protein TnpA [Sandaracinobacteroides saxicola]|uniref:Transposase n=1 Tax=Sandaracinobacteroides saxicola TaxID=2759707 RepID=A0A7G5IE28_9SPHN|nr:transposase [Sandaracinobacteroides saxicola]QMW21620.1 transposase [Sandaracinobacteroides saxicola]
MGQVSVFAGPERRRRWSQDERLRILQEAFAPGACVSEVARRHDVSTSLVYAWRKQFAPPLTPVDEGLGFAEAVVTEAHGPVPAAGASGAVVIVEMPRGRVSISASASPALAGAVLRALR